MPRLKGNSSQGSKPVTRPSRTFNWMPHCWPQKQQWVWTRRSGACVRSSPQPPGGVNDGCGPKRSTSAASGSGGLATRAPLDLELGGGERRPLAGRTEILPRLAFRRLVIEAELAEDEGEILRVEARGEA